MKNYYSILNVKQTASEDDIKRSYRTLAKRYHPDVNPDDSQAAAKFADINEAYTVLGDSQARAVYDARLRNAEETSSLRRPENVRRAQEQYRAKPQPQAKSQQSQSQPQNIHTAQTVIRFNAPTKYGPQVQAIIQAQVQAAYKTVHQHAYAAGRESGYREAMIASESEKAKLDANVKSLLADKSKLKDELNTLENDRRDLENELFNRDRELAQTRERMQHLEDQLRMFIKTRGNVSGSVANENAMLREQLKRIQAQVAEANKAHANRMATDKVRENTVRENLAASEAKIAEHAATIDTLTREVERLKSANERLSQQVADDEYRDDGSDIVMWIARLKSDTRKSVSTLYGSLGVLYWSSTEKMYQSLVKMLSKTAEADEQGKARAEAAKRAYTVLSDPAKRAAYNRTIGITDEMINEARMLSRRNQKVFAEYRNGIASDEFWKYLDGVSDDAITGNPDAQNTLGEIYYEGVDIPADYEQAVFWFKEAAKQKHLDAMYNLGLCYINGAGVEKNSTVGLGYIRQAQIRK